MCQHVKSIYYTHLEYSVCEEKHKNTSHILCQLYLVFKSHCQNLHPFTLFSSPLEISCQKSKFSSDLLDSNHFSGFFYNNKN